jgi:hypothetical protein
MDSPSEVTAARETRIARWLAGGSIAASHALAGAVTFACFVITPLALFTMVYVGAIVFACVTNGELGGPLFFPVGALFVGGMGLVCTVLVAGAGLLLDLVRRWFCWSIWASLAIVAAAATCAPLVVAVVRPHQLSPTLVVSAAYTAAFGIHWTALALSESARKLVLRIGRSRTRRPWSARTTR